MFFHGHTTFRVPNWQVYHSQLQPSCAPIILSIGNTGKPYWWASADEWEKTIRKFDIRFDVHTNEPPFFVMANTATRKVTLRFIPIQRLLNLDVTREADSAALDEMAKQVKFNGFCDGRTKPVFASVGTPNPWDNSFYKMGPGRQWRTKVHRDHLPTLRFYIDVFPDGRRGRSKL